MSYSRWDRSSWYAFWDSGSGEDMESQVLALWHRNKATDAEQLHSWTYPQVEKADEAWLREHYDGLSEEDMTDARHIIRAFLSQVRRKYVIGPVLENPCKNVTAALDFYFSDDDDVDRPKMLEALLTCPPNDWQPMFLERLRGLTLDEVWRHNEKFTASLNCANRFTDRTMIRAILQSWVQGLTTRLNSGWHPEVSPEEAMLLTIFGASSDPWDAVREIQSKLSEL